ncbi:pseudouridine synthase [Rhodothermus profundi]|uniref:Pseudouridine synthase n=1 Tax=Rhodothermus profundi TaxID=633813 RepID=A0A1M6RH75_9BACT|nr:pseudouridine synthase [Rhodothermus profundi]SHK31783.1 ribosomal large subunit pseudouridine synthase E [Rhodothermus profundi]
MRKPIRHLLFWKPYGVLSQFTDPAGRPTLKRYIDVPDVYPVGRLDMDSEGLLLLTSDGRLKYRLLHPRYGHWRTYWVQVERIPDDEALRRLAEGVVIAGGYRTRPARVRRIEPPTLPPRPVPIRYRKTVPTCWLEISIREGKNRQVRRMTAAVGHPTLRLVRVALGPLRLDGLAPGQWRPLTPDEEAALYRLCRLRKPGR